MRARLAIPLALLLSFAVSASIDAQQKPANKQPANPQALTISKFQNRVNTYVARRDKLEDTLKDLPKQTDPASADRHQRALQKLVQTSRSSAKPGDIFTPDMQQLVRQLLRPIFAGKDGRQIRDEIHDNEYKGNAPLAVNARYPDEVPLSTVPPQVLQSLPKLPGELEYRFIGTNLILFDPHAHIIVDYMERAYR
ncbi:MAG TPA: hypothetical protein VL262_13175 [Vicinamibacterales bacterium]|jgi:hypothetical protein|nr:hypothetical protein [Vicinamibacterales bacterium]